MVAPQPSPIATLFPGYFALVMATGIVAVASDQQNLDLLAEALYVITATAYIILAILLATRMLRYWSNFTADATNRVYGETNINRWRDGAILLRMVMFALFRIKFV